MNCSPWLDVWQNRLYLPSTSTNPPGKMTPTKFATFMALASTALSTTSPWPSQISLQPVYTNGSIQVEHLSTAGNLDGFKMLTPAARKSADFWYFDVFSASSNQTLNIVFFNSGEFAQYPHPLAVQVSGVYPNGSDFYFEAMADEGVGLSNGPDGIKGDWKGIGTFHGSALDKPDVGYEIVLDSPVMDIYGTVIFRAVSQSLQPFVLRYLQSLRQHRRIIPAT